MFRLMLAMGALLVVAPVAVEAQEQDTATAPRSARQQVEERFGAEGELSDDGSATWYRSPCLGRCDQAPAALVSIAGDQPLERAQAPVTAESVLRLLSGGGTQSNNLIGGKAMGSAGYVGVWLQLPVGSAPLYASILLDDGTKTSAGLEYASFQQLPADGQWHLYEWPLYYPALWASFAGGDGVIGGPDVFVHISAVERAGLRGLSEGQKISYEEQRDPKRGKTSAENLKAV